MHITRAELWLRFQKWYVEFPSARLAIDLSRLGLGDEFLERMRDPMAGAFQFMKELEAGAIANPDEKRRVGHYWLRDADLAPNPGDRDAIRGALEAVRTFVADVHAGRVRGSKGETFEHLLVIGIGGSALGPQFVAHALGHPATDRLRVHFFDNTDPDGMDRTLASLSGKLGATLVAVISKSGGTPETRNGMLEAERAFVEAGLKFPTHAVAITEESEGSQLFRKSRDEKWLRIFPMWDWVGGRTSETSAVGLLPAALQGLDIQQMLEGAKACDVVTRLEDLERNPAALLALAWFHATSGRGAKDMVILPYKDRLELFAKYLQQLVMESLGKERDLDGQVVNQGISVYGNKGSTDQHAYIQQLRDGLANFFVIFVHVLRSRSGPSMEVEPGVTSGDFLNGFYLGTRDALFENGRESVSITVPEVSPFTVGSLIALFERAVGLYACLIRINAYHQPGVEAGKQAAKVVIALQRRLVAELQARPGKAMDAAELATACGSDDPESVFKIAQHLAANDRGLVVSGHGASARFSVKP